MTCTVPSGMNMEQPLLLDDAPRARQCHATLDTGVFHTSATAGIPMRSSVAWSSVMLSPGLMPFQQGGWQGPSDSTLPSARAMA